MYAAYWQKDQLAVYGLSAAGVTRIAAGRIADLKPLRLFGKKILIVSGAASLRLRKRYPALSDADLEKVIGNEIGDIFPLVRPSFHFTIQEKEKMYRLVDIWAWESDALERVKAVFDFTHVMPEELLYSADRPEMILCRSGELAQLAAYGEGKFLGSTSFAAPVSVEGIDFFRKTLGRYAADLKTLRIYGDDWPALQPPDMEVTRAPVRDYPFCLDHVGRVDLGDFKGERERFTPTVDVALKIAVCAALAYGLSLFLSLRNYDASLTRLSQRIDALSKPLAAAAVEPGKPYAESLAELEKKLDARIRPLDAMEVLAESLPPNSFLSRLTINETKLEAYVSAKEPVDVLKALGANKAVRAVKLKGALTKDNQTGSYNLVVEVEL